MRRREFIAGLGITSASPMVARAQQPSMPAVGYLSVNPEVSPATLSGMAEAGYVVGRNVRIEISSSTKAHLLPDTAADLVRSQVAVILAVSSASALAAKAATSTIPIVFGIGDDPIRLGLVASVNHPGGNLTGTTNNNVELEGKRFEMIHLLLPSDNTIAAIVNPNNPAAERQATDIQAAARILGRTVRIFRAGNVREIDQSFKAIAQAKLDAVFVGADAYFGTRREQFVTLAAYEAIPALYSRREFAEVGGLVSYGTELNTPDRQQGVYIGRILKGEKPADLPVVQATKFELVINLQAARTLGFQIPTAILALADTVIE
jgi:putative tryptophan/tyrosine transport system substrate-binding protein